MGQKTGRDVKCVICGKVHYRQKYQLKANGRYFCSRECASKGHSKLLTKKEYGKVICPECGKEFQSHWRGAKKFCSTSCSSRYNLSIINSKQPKQKGTKPELAFAKLLEKSNIEYKFQYPLQWKRGWKKWYDFYIPKYNMLIEVDGTYWHGREVKTADLNEQQWNTRRNDRLKNYLSKVRGYKLKRIWSNEINSLSYSKLIKLLNE